MHATLIRPRKISTMFFVFLAAPVEAEVHWVRTVADGYGQLCLGDGCPFCMSPIPSPVNYRWFAPAAKLRSELVSPTAQEEEGWRKRYRAGEKTPRPRSRNRLLLDGLAVVELLPSQLGELPAAPTGGDVISQTKGESLKRLGSWQGPPQLPEAFDWQAVVLRIFGQEKMVANMRENLRQPTAQEPEEGSIFKFRKWA